MQLSISYGRPLTHDGQNVNTVDVIFPAWPIFLYTNPSIGKYLLLPLFEYQASGQYPNGWSVHDMGMRHLRSHRSNGIKPAEMTGANYPNATGHNDGMSAHLL